MIRKQFALAALFIFAGALALFSSATSEGSNSSSRSGALPPSCPKKALREGAEAATNRNTRSNHSLVPSRPDELQLCRYYDFGMNQTPQTQARAGKLAAERLLRRLALVRSIGREFNVSGCRFAGNGRARPVAMSPRLLNRITGLIPPRS